MLKKITLNYIYFNITFELKKNIRERMLKCMKIYSGHSYEVLCTIFNYDDKLIFSGSCDNTIKVWNVVKGK